VLAVYMFIGITVIVPLWLTDRPTGSFWPVILLAQPSELLKHRSSSAFWSQLHSVLLLQLLVLWSWNCCDPRTCFVVI